MANKRIIELQERTQLDMNDYLIVDSSTSTRKLSMSTLLNYMTMTQMIFVTELPTEDISTSTIYLVPHSGSNTQWDEYIYRENEWVLIGTSTIDLSAIYQTKTDNNLQTTSKQIVGAINELNNDLPGKVYGSFTPTSTSTRGEIVQALAAIYNGLTSDEKRNCKVVRNDGFSFQQMGNKQFVTVGASLTAGNIQIYQLDFDGGKYLGWSSLDSQTADMSSWTDVAGRTHYLIVG